MGYPTATRLAPAHAVLNRRGNDATLLMLPPRGPREGARGGKPRRGECLLQTKVRNAASAISLASARPSLSRIAPFLYILAILSRVMHGFAKG
jgi:hypothetical protein